MWLNSLKSGGTAGNRPENIAMSKYFQDGFLFALQTIV